MNFIDDIVIYLKAGDGGNGCISYIKKNKKYIPNGGDGGYGGNIYFILDKNMNLNLYNIKKINNFYSFNGQNGSNNNKFGKNGNNLFINVPKNTKILDFNNNDVIGIINNFNNKILVARGGYKGLGNNKIFNSKYNLGKKGDYIIVRLILEIESDIGVFGFTNSGVSTFCNKILNKKNINSDSYFFKTQYPILNNFFINKYSYLSILEIPGFLIKNKIIKFNNNINYIKHLKKCKLIINIIDISLFLKNKNLFFILYIKNIIKEFKKNKIFINDNFWILFNKIDLYNKEIYLLKIKNLFIKYKINFKYYFISNINIKNILNIKNKIINYFEKYL